MKIVDSKGENIYLKIGKKDSGFLKKDRKEREHFQFIEK